MKKKDITEMYIVRTYQTDDSDDVHWLPNQNTNVGISLLCMRPKVLIYIRESGIDL